MKNLILVVVTGLLIASCSPQIYQASNIDSLKKDHQTVAVLPFEASFDVQRLPKGVKGEDIEKALFYTSQSVQNHAYFYLLDRTYVKDLNIKFQKIEETNEILELSGIPHNELISLEKGELCEMLGVDAVISGNVRMTRPMSDGAALIVGVFAGFWGNTNQTFMTMTIHDKQDSKLIWRYSYSASGTVGSNSKRMTRRLIKKAGRHFPYRRK